MKKFLLVVLILLLFVVACSAVLDRGRQPAPFEPGSAAAQWLRGGPVQVVSRDEIFIDSSRATAPNGDFPGEPQRRLAGTLWYPAQASDGPYPLIIFSHGFSSTREGGAYLGQHLASHGFVVVAVDYPLTHFDAPGSPYVKDVLNQPADVSFLIDTLIAQSDTPEHPMAGLVDAGRVGVTGISLGGLTSELVAFHPQLRDERVGAALSIAGPTSLFTRRFFSFAEVPFLMLAGDIDALVPYASNAKPMLEKLPGSELVTVSNGSHTGFSGPSAPLRWMSNPDAIGCWVVKGNIDDAIEEPWYDEIGSVEQGIDHSARNELCLMDPLPKAMNVLRQQMITTVVVRSFFESHFAPTPGGRESARSFLAETLARELPDEVRYQRGEG